MEGLVMACNSIMENLKHSQQQLDPRHINYNNHVLSLRSRGFCDYGKTVEKVHVKSFKKSLF